MLLSKEQMKLFKWIENRKKRERMRWVTSTIAEREGLKCMYMFEFFLWLSSGCVVSVDSDNFDVGGWLCNTRDRRRKKRSVTSIQTNVERERGEEKKNKKRTNKNVYQ
jgi:hypothetical protein